MQARDHIKFEKAIVHGEGAFIETVPRFDYCR